MDIKKIEEIYSLGFDGLADILKKEHITLKLEHLSNIPKEWIPIIEKSLGVTNSHKENENGEGKETQIKITVEESTNEHQRHINQQKTRNVIEPSMADRPKKNRLNRKSKQTGNNNTGIEFYAYVKYVGPNKDHAFVRVFDDLNELDDLDLRRRDHNDFKIQGDCSSFMNGQIIGCGSKNEKYGLVRLKATIFHGTITTEGSPTFIDWMSFQDPKVLTGNIGYQVSQSDQMVISTSILYSSRRGFKFNLQEEEPDKMELLKRVEVNFIKALSKNHFTSVDKAIVNTYRSLNSFEDYQEKISLAFNVDFDNENCFTDQDLIQNLILKWITLDNSVLFLEKIGHLENLPVYIQLWLNDILPIDFFQNHLIDVLVQHVIKNKNNEGKSLLSSLREGHISELSKILGPYLNQELSIDSLDSYEALKTLIEVSSLKKKEQHEEKLNRFLSGDISYELWKEGKTIRLDKVAALEHFAYEDAQIQKRIIENLDDEDLLGVLSDIKPQSGIRINERLVNIFSDRVRGYVNAVSFDLESDIERIYEMAWNDANAWHFHKGEGEVNKALLTFKEQIESEQNLLIGHNIIAFDCPILEKEGIVFNYDNLWDTMRVEVLLSPELKNYALKTAHTAKQDAQLTLSLFTNQVLRIIAGDIDEETLSVVLSSEIIDGLKKIREKVPFDCISLDFLNESKTRFYRPQRLKNGIISKLREKLNKSTTPMKLILGSEGLRYSVKDLEDIQYFPSDEKTKDFEILDGGAIDKNKSLSSYSKTVLKQFLKYCKSEKLPSYWVNLSPFVKTLLLNELNDVFQLFGKKSEPDLLEGTVYLSLRDLLSKIDQIKAIDKLDLFILQPDLLSTTEKIHLKDVDQEFLKLVEKSHHFWMKFSGGQSFVPLTSQQMKGLNIEVPDYMTNFWIEKYQVGKYRVWGSYDWESLISSLNIEERHEYRLNRFDFPKAQMNLIRASFSTIARAGVIRFNPESIHRSRYWVFQKELIKQVCKSTSPAILLIHQYNEIVILEEYFRKLGYYIPESSISLGRRLELIYKKRSGGRLIVAHLSQIEKILELNYEGSLEIILDSFNLGENFYTAQGTNYFHGLIEKIENTTDFTKTTNSDDDEMDDEIQEMESKSRPHIKDTFFLLKLQLPFINHLRNLMLASDPNHRLWVLDSRVSDFPDLINYWNSNGQSLNLWQNEEQYENDVEFADKHIPSAKPLKKLPFDNEKVKQILSEVFINGNPWYDYQVPYLDEIINGENDLLVTLPTGGGKSLLFQGPALLKGSFTNRLTVVVTPLKALMEDQVNNLWDKGFHGCVEYLNTDRGTDVQLIYRAMAGGELALLYVTPERFRSHSFLKALSLRIQSDGGLEYFVFDEAHCVSQWGHEFRPDYFNCAKRVNQLKQESLKESPLLLFSATVSEKIYNDFNMIFA